MKQHTYMDKSEVAKNVMKNAVNMVLQDALDILEADDGRSFEEKRDAVIKRLTMKADTELSQLPVEHTIANKDSAEIKTDFWKYGTAIHVDETVFLRPVESKDHDAFLSIQRASPLLQSMEERAVPGNGLAQSQRGQVPDAVYCQGWGIYRVLWNQEYQSPRMGNRH